MDGGWSTLRAGALGTLAVMSACASVDRDKAEAYLGARESQVTHERETAELVCRRGTLPAAQSAAALQEQTAAGASVRASAAAAERALLATNPPERIRSAAAGLSSAAAAVQAGTAAVTRSCPEGSSTSSTAAARRQLELAVGRYRDQAAVFRSEI